MDEDERLSLRAEVLAECGAPASALPALLEYTASPFRLDTLPALPLADEPHVEAWREYERDARRIGAFEALRKRFFQLRFSVRAGMSGDEAYRAATRRGRFVEEPGREGLALDRPGELLLEVHSTMAGAIPVLTAGTRDDFVTLVRAFTARNEPEPVPRSMGACIVKGLNNWDRVRRYREDWERSRPSPPGAGAWEAELRRLVPRKELYQDRFIILSRGPYSGVSAAEVGMDEESWLDLSTAIRRGHELTHYLTYRLFGVMRNNLLDELLADFAGITGALGRYPPDLALRFLGLEDHPRYRPGGRLENYRGVPPLSDEAFGVLPCLAVRCVEGLAARSEGRQDLASDARAMAAFVARLAGLSIEELARGVE